MWEKEKELYNFEQLGLAQCSHQTQNSLCQEKKKVTITITIITVTIIIIIIIIIMEVILPQNKKIKKVIKTFFPHNSDFFLRITWYKLSIPTFFSLRIVRYTVNTIESYKVRIVRYKLAILIFFLAIVSLYLTILNFSCKL